jgi:hypothetical protein
MTVRFKLFGCEVRSYNWHSINIIPHGGAHDICTDVSPRRVVGRAYWATVFGHVIDVLIPTSHEPKRAWMTPVLGPIWSRETRRWYHIEVET